MKAWNRMDVASASDEHLMQALPAQTEALDALYERHSRAALGLATRMVGERETAEEVVQEAFLALWRNAGRYQAGRGSVRTWLLSIVHHRAIDRLRGRAPVAPLPGELGPDPNAPDVWALTAQRLDRAAIAEALGGLPDEQRQAIELAYFSGLTQTQIASTLGLPLGTVKGRLRLGLGRLRTLLRGRVEADA
jgi:RNA polymerase sigma-70 factor, ECF subfamily